jgi:hypothetical protein
VAHEKGVEIHVEKVEDIQDIMRYGIMSTPGVLTFSFRGVEVRAPGTVLEGVLRRAS